jgi:uncharacterized protein (TIGR00255 family)
MIRSMTGYGDAEGDCPAGHLKLEVKTVNHRFFNTSIKTPSGFDKYERDIAGALKTQLTRGHVSVFLTLDRSAGEGAAQQRVDVERARSYRDALESVRDELGLSGGVDLGMLARFGDIFRTPDTDRTEGIEPEMIRELVERAAEVVREHREAEGARLAEDMAGRLDAMAEGLGRIEARAPERLVAERDRLRGVVRELTEQTEVDEDRLAREIAYLAERWDINEELVRFRAHIGLFREALGGDGAEPVGKRLGFLVQEMHREANTIGSKANDAAISHAAVALKEEVERLREQVENVE